MATSRPSVPMAYRIKVILKDSRPPIWRRVQVAGDVTLHTFHKILQTVMGWTDSYRHLFIIDRVFYGKPDLEYHFEVRDEKDFTLGQILSDDRDRLVYEYDFEDCWQHEIVIEDITNPASAMQYPVCLAGKRACPPEDCGGIWEYMDILEAVEDPRHPDYYSMLKWVENGFDPESFNLEEINRKLKKVK